MKLHTNLSALVLLAVIPLSAWPLPVGLDASQNASQNASQSVRDSAKQPVDPLYQALGRREGLSRMMVALVAQVKADARIGHFFKDSDSEELAKQLTDQLCQVAGGPCQYKGGKMDKVHRDMGVRKGDFNALVELLQTTLQAHGVPFAAQNRLLARLAPMHRDIVEPQGPPPAEAAPQ